MACEHIDIGLYMIVRCYLSDLDATLKSNFLHNQTMSNELNSAEKA